MKLSITASINVLACVKATDMKTKQDLTTKEGKQLYELAIVEEEKKTIAGQEFSSQIVGKLKSEIQLEKGEHSVGLIQFAMSEVGKSKVDLFYRVVSVNSASATKKTV